MRMQEPPEVTLASSDGVRTVVLVEGRSDQAAVEALAVRRNRDLAGEGVAVVAVGGATTVGRFVDRYGPAGLGLELAGLCDAGEEGSYRRALQKAGLGSDLGSASISSGSASTSATPISRTS